MKTSKTFALLAVPAVLAAAIVSTTGALAKSPASHSARPAGATSAATVKLSAAGAADAAKPFQSTEPASSETDTAGGHADNPSDPNADHQFSGEE